MKDFQELDKQLSKEDLLLYENGIRTPELMEGQAHRGTTPLSRGGISHLTRDAITRDGVITRNVLISKNHIG